jgi:hypothetical protein
MVIADSLLPCCDVLDYALLIPAPFPTRARSSIIIQKFYEFHTSPYLHIMALPNKASVTVRFSKPGFQPPIYLAGSFSEWQPQEMQYTLNEHNEHQYYKELEVELGKEYQYKFRIGQGDWWVLDEDSQIGTFVGPCRKSNSPFPTAKSQS